MGSLANAWAKTKDPYAWQSPTSLPLGPFQTSSSAESFDSPAPSQSERAGSRRMTYRDVVDDLLKSPGKENLGILPHQSLFLQSAFRPVPLIDPVDHAEQCERRRSRADIRLRASLALHLSDQIFHKVHVVFFSRVDFPSHRRR